MGSGALSYLVRIELRQRARSIALLALLVAIVVGTVLTSVAGARRTRTAFDRYLGEVNTFDALVLVEGAPIAPERVAEADSVEAAVGLRWFLAVPEAAGDGFFPMFVPDDPRIPEEYLRVPVVAGRLPNPDEPREVALGERTARRLGVHAGQSLPMESYTPAQIEDPDSFGDPQGPQLNLDIVGIVRDPGDVAGRETDLDPTVLTPAFAAAYEGEIGLFGTGMFVDIKANASIEDLATDLEQLGQFELDSLLGREALRDQVDPTLASMANGLRTMALVTALVGAVAVVQALARGATDRSADHPELRALGIGRSTLLSRLSIPSAAAAAVGIVAGCAASIPASALLPIGVARRAEPDPGIAVDGAVLAGGAGGAALLLAAAIVGVAVSALHRERQAIHRSARPSALATRMAGVGAPVSVVSGLRLALDPGRGLRATPVRAAMGATALGAVGVLATVVFGSSLHHAVVTPAVYGWGWDAALAGADGDQVSDGMVDERALIADESFAAVAEFVHDLEVTVDGAPARTAVLEDRRGHTSFVVVEGAEPLGPDEVAVGGRTLDQLELGDALDVSAGGPAQSLEVVGVVALPVGVDGGSSSSGLAMSHLAAEAIGFTGSCDGDVACSRNYAVTAAAGVDALAAARRHGTPDVVEVARPSPPSEVARLTAVEDLPRLLAALLGIIAIVAVTHAATVTVRQRRRDLALLRVLGFSSRQLRRVVTVQVAVLALGGSVLGAVIGVVVGRQAWAAVADGVPLPVVITVSPVAIIGVPLAIVALSHCGRDAGARRGRAPARRHRAEGGVMIHRHRVRPSQIGAPS